MPDISVAAQIRCVKREISFRERVYRDRVAAGRMKDSEAVYELMAMRAVLATLEGIADGGQLSLFQEANRD